MRQICPRSTNQFLKFNASFIYLENLPSLCFSRGSIRINNIRPRFKNRIKPSLDVKPAGALIILIALRLETDHKTVLKVGPPQLKD